MSQDWDGQGTSPGKGSGTELILNRNRGWREGLQCLPHCRTWKMGGAGGQLQAFHPGSKGMWTSPKGREVLTWE